MSDVHIGLLAGPASSPLLLLHLHLHLVRERRRGAGIAGEGAFLAFACAFGWLGLSLGLLGAHSVSFLFRDNFVRHEGI